MKFPILIPSVLLALLAGCDTGLPEGDWDNPRDPSGTAFFPPLVGLRDTALRDGENGVVQSFVRPQVAPVDSCRWILDGEVLPTRDCSIPTRGWAPGNHAVVVQASDTRGIASLPKTVNVWIGNQPPRLEPVGDERVGASAAVSKGLSARDPDGTIVEVAWDTVPGRYSVVSSRVDLGPLPGGGVRRVHWRAKDDDGAVGESSFEVRSVAAPLPEVQMLMASTGYWTGSHWSYSVDLPVEAVFSFLVLVYPTDDPGDSLVVTANVGQGAFTCGTLREFGSRYLATECTQSSGYLWGSSWITATVTNGLGEGSSVSFSVNAQRVTVQRSSN